MVGLHGEAGPEPDQPDAPGGDDRPHAESCDACARTGCFRHGSDIAALFSDRAIHLDWRLPSPAIPTRAGAAPWRIAFPGPTLARKGAYEVRAAARSLDLEVLLLGADLEGSSFWNGLRTSRPDPAAGPFGWLRDVMAVVQPALVEQQPRRLLAALAAGVPVLATPACGLDGLGIIPISPLDSALAVTLADRRIVLVGAPEPTGS